MEATTSSKNLPECVEQLLATFQEFEALLNKAKQSPIGDIYQWYPYTTTSSIHHLLPVLTQHFDVFRRSLESGRLLDLGCADGDLAYYFAGLGCEVAAVDLPASNFNWMKGVRTLRERLNYRIDIHEMDLDAQFSLPDETYGLVLFLGLLYHLKNPLHVLESLARTSRYCMLSTRVAQVTPAGTSIQAEPVAYLLDHREANDDPTNYWIFSEAGLLRLIKRAGWRVIGSNLVGCREASNPVDPAADERMFVFLRSQLCSAPAEVALLEGWTDPVLQKWAWTEKRFSFQVRLCESSRPPAFLLGFIIPEAISSVSAVTVSCRVNGVAAGSQIYRSHGDQIFESPFPDAADHTRPMLFEFFVEHTFDPQPDPRDLGVIMPFTGAIRGTGAPILFWIE